MISRPASFCGLALAIAAAVAPLAVAQSALDAADEANKPAETLPLADDTLLLDLTEAGARLVAVGWRGHVLLSDDRGATWRQASSVPTRNMLTGVFFSDAEYGWAVGHDETVLKTTDGGENWQRVYFAPDTQQALFDVWFADRQRGIAVGAYGAYLTTTDGGTTWVSRKFEALPVSSAVSGEPSDDEFAPDYHLNRIVAAGDKLYIAAEAGQLYRSDDGGMNWQTLPSPYEGSFYGVLPLEDGALLAFGLRGNLWRSNDAGASWIAIPSDTTAMLTDGLQLTDGAVVIAGLSGVLLVSPDGGASWQLQQQPNRKAIAAMVPGGPAMVIAVGEAGVQRVAVAAP